MLYSFDSEHFKQTRPMLDGEITDEQLMDRIQHGDEEALVMLHRRHHALLRTIISRMISNDHDVDELIQEWLLDVWRHATKYRAQKGKALAWLITLARRRTIDRIRRKMAYCRAQDRLREETGGHGEAVQAGADETASMHDRAEAVARLIARLPEAQQQAVHLAFYRGMTQRQIAAHTGIPLGTIKTRLELALRKLRSAVVAFGELHGNVQPAHV
jgi:RNA polymerase sigma-70 factor, ECF subfamily